MASKSTDLNTLTFATQFRRATNKANLIGQSHSMESSADYLEVTVETPCVISDIKMQITPNGANPNGVKAWYIVSWDRVSLHGTSRPIYFQQSGHPIKCGLPGQDRISFKNSCDDPSIFPIQADVGDIFTFVQGYTTPGGQSNTVEVEFETDMHKSEVAI